MSALSRIVRCAVVDYRVHCLGLLFASFSLASNSYAKDVNLLVEAQDVNAVLSVSQLTPQLARMGEQLIDGVTQEGVGLIREPVQWVIDLGQVVSSNEIVLHLIGESSSGSVGDIELLASIASADTGFQLLRRGRIDANRSDMRLAFRPIGIRWLKVRLTPATEAVDKQLSELELIGHVGVPEDDYAFKESPVDAMDVLKQLEQFLPRSISETERALFDDAADGQLDDYSFADAALLASGVREDQDRIAYLERIDELESAFKVELDAASTAAEQGRQLLEWLHQGPLAGGYDEPQSDVDVLLNDKTYNCVSSAILYSILARRLGLDVRGVEVPDHVFAILYDGATVADIETTDAAGFDPSRNLAALESFESTTGFNYIPDTHPEKRRELTPLGLTAEIYYNRGVVYAADKQYQNALMAYFSALSLDKASHSAAKNVLTTLVRWSGELLEQQEFDKSIDVLNVGLALAPDDAGLKHIFKVTWQTQILIASKGDDIQRFLDITNRAQSALPDANFEEQQSLFVIARAQALVESHDFEGALEKTTEFVQQLNAKSQDDVRDYQIHLILRWAYHAIEYQTFESALDALNQGLQIAPGNHEIKRYVAYLLQEWSEVVHATQGEAAARAVVVLFKEQFPTLKGVDQASRTYALRRIKDLITQARYDEALDLNQDYRQWIGDYREFDKIDRILFDALAHTHIDSGDWQSALSVYAKALSSSSDNGPNSRDDTATGHPRSNGSMDDKDGGQAFDIFRQALQRFRGEHPFSNNIRFVAQERLKELNPADSATAAVIGDIRQQFAGVKGLNKIFTNYYLESIENILSQGDFEQAASVALIATDALTDPDDIRKIVVYLYDTWAQSLVDKEQWQEAVAVYDEARTMLPNNPLIKQNAVATWDMWARVHLDQEDWDGAIDVYEKGLQKFPGTRVFKKNIEYSKQQKTR